MQAHKAFATSEIASIDEQPLACRHAVDYFDIASAAGVDGNGESGSAPGGFEIALGVFVAIVLHKPFDGLTLVAMMRIAKVGKTKTKIANVVFSFGVPIGVLLFQIGDEVSHQAIAAALAFSAGMFLCISLSDLLPELQFHGHDRFSLTFALILGLSIAWGISSLHSHSETHEHTDNSAILQE